MNNKIIKVATSSMLLCTMTLYTTPMLAFTKEETVYTKLDKEGNKYNTIVNTHLINENEEKIINDLSDLLNIKNVNGDEEFTLEENKLIWSAEGKDIYYEGNSEKELPIECNVKYELDGKEISAEEIAGKSGKVKITIEYVNKDRHIVNINGKNVEMYTPFMVACGTIIENSNNKNVKITNGKVIDNGNKTMVFGIAMPGMQESLGISKNTLEIPEKVEISMETTKFELNNIITYVTPVLSEETDFDGLDKLKNMYSMANELKNASSQLVEGSNKLSDGLSTLNVGTNMLSDELNAEITKYEVAKSKLANREEIEKQILQIVNDQMQELLPGVKELAEQEAENVIYEHKEELEKDTVQIASMYTKKVLSEKLDELAKNDYKILTTEQEAELKNALTQDIQRAIGEIKTDSQISALLQEVEENMKKQAKNEVKSVIANNKVDLSKVGSMTPEMQAKVIENYSTQISKIKEIDPNLTDLQALQIIGAVSNSTLDTINAKINTAIDNVNIDNEEIYEEKIKEYVAAVAQNVANTFTDGSLEALETYKTELTKKIAEELKKQILSSEAVKFGSNMVKQEVEETVEKIASSTAKTLADKYTEDLAKEITNNLIKKSLSGLLSGTQIDKELSKYEELINSKIEGVDSKITTLKNALKELTDGTEALSEGAKQLSEGMNKFDKEGIQKIYNLVNGDLRNIDLRVEKLQDLSKEYNTFTMLDGENKGSVKFIMIMDSIKENENKKEEIILENNSEEIKKENNIDNEN